MTFELESLPINAADLAVAAIVLISGLLAFIRGAVREFFSIAAWVGAAAATYYGFAHARPFAERMIEQPILADVATGLVLFVVTLVVVSLIAAAVCRRVKQSSLDALDRSLGFLFGLVRGAVVVCIAYVIMTWAMVPDEHPAWLKEARARPLVERGVDLLVLVIPPDARANWQDAVAASAEAAEGTFDDRTPFEIMMSPPPVRIDEGDAGYSDAERRELERLIESTQ